MYTEDDNQYPRQFNNVRQGTTLIGTAAISSRVPFTYLFIKGLDTARPGWIHARLCNAFLGMISAIFDLSPLTLCINFLKYLLFIIGADSTGCSDKLKTSQGVVRHGVKSCDWMLSSRNKRSKYARAQVTASHIGCHQCSLLIERFSVAAGRMMERTEMRVDVAAK